MYSTLETWFRSEASGNLILGILGATVLLFGAARIASRKYSRLSRITENLGYALLAVAFGLLMVGAAIYE